MRALVLTCVFDGRRCPVCLPFFLRSFAFVPILHSRPLPAARARLERSQGFHGSDCCRPENGRRRRRKVPRKFRQLRELAARLGNAFWRRIFSSIFADRRFSTIPFVPAVLFPRSDVFVITSLRSACVAHRYFNPSERTDNFVPTKTRSIDDRSRRYFAGSPITSPLINSRALCANVRRDVAFRRLCRDRAARELLPRRRA